MSLKRRNVHLGEEWTRAKALAGRTVFRSASALIRATLAECLEQTAKKYERKP